MNKALPVLAAALIGISSLAGCTHSASAAAVVDGVQISEAEITAASRVAGPIVGRPALAVEGSVTEAEVLGLIAQKVAAKYSVDLSDAARADLMAQNEILAALSAKPETKVLAMRLADSAVASNKVGPDKWAAECAATKVEFNPQYGTWSKEECKLDPLAIALAKAAPTAAPTNG